MPLSCASSGYLETRWAWGSRDRARRVHGGKAASTEYVGLSDLAWGSTGFDVINYQDYVGVFLVALPIPSQLQQSCCETIGTAIEDSGRHTSNKSNRSQQLVCNPKAVKTVTTYMCENCAWVQAQTYGAAGQDYKSLGSTNRRT